MGKVLVIDDEANVRFCIGQVLAGQDAQVFEAEDAASGLKIADRESPDVILLDIRLGNCSGLDVFHDLRRINPKQLVVFITGHGTTDTAIEAMKLGAYDYLVKPLDLKQLQQVVKQAFQISRSMNVQPVVDVAEDPAQQAERIIGSGAAMRALCKQIGRIAGQDINVLITGESGTGKELVARALYSHSHRRQGPFLAINCAAIPEALLESELFGHERGAFTGAENRRIGKFEQCHGGTMLLDEIGDMSASTQAKILRLLQEKCFERLGGNESISADVRILAATNQDLELLTEQGRFRKDLYYRLRGTMLHLPPLRERREDIAELAHYFLFRFNQQTNNSIQSISPKAIELLEQYDWPGNIRELQSVIREALIVAAGTVLLPEFLPIELSVVTRPMPDTEGEDVGLPDVNWQTLAALAERTIGGEESDVYRRLRDCFDRLVISRAMLQTDGNQNRAAEILGISRVTLRSKLRAMDTREGSNDAAAGASPPGEGN